MKYKNRVFGSLLLISTMIFTSCNGSDAYNDVEISGEEVIHISIPDTTVESESESSTEESQVSESSETAPEALIISELNNRHAFGTRSATYGLIPEGYRMVLDRAMYVLVGDIGAGEVIGNGLDGLYEARKAMPDKNELLANTGYVIADFDGNGSDELMIFVLSGAADAQKSFKVVTLYSFMGNDSPILLLSQAPKENYYMLPDGKIYFTETLDAIHHSVGIFEISKTGRSVDPVELYFTDYLETLEDGTPDTNSEYGWFRSYDGQLTSETSHEYDYMGKGFEPAIKADLVEFTPNEYCLFESLRHRYEIVDKEVSVKDIDDLCKEAGGHMLDISDDYERGVINGLLADGRYEGRVFCIGDGFFVKVVKEGEDYILEEADAKTKEAGYICEFDY